MIEIQAFHTDQSVEQITKDTVKEKWFNAEEALTYGIVDEIFHKTGDCFKCLKKDRCWDESCAANKIKKSDGRCK